LKKVEEKLHNWELKYSERKGKKWITLIVGVVLCGFGGWILMPLTNKIKHSLYNREGLEGVTTEKFGDTKISEVLTDEVMIVAYDF
jgi:hypothetical protein